MIRETRNHGLTMGLIVEKLAPIFDNVDANPRDRTEYLEGIHGEVLLFVRKAVKLALWEPTSERRHE